MRCELLRDEHHVYNRCASGPTEVFVDCGVGLSPVVDNLGWSRMGENEGCWTRKLRFCYGFRLCRPQATEIDRCGSVVNSFDSSQRRKDAKTQRRKRRKGNPGALLCAFASLRGNDLKPGTACPARCLPGGSRRCRSRGASVSYRESVLSRAQALHSLSRRCNRGASASQ